MRRFAALWAARMPAAALVSLVLGLGGCGDSSSDASVASSSSSSGSSGSSSAVASTPTRPQLTQTQAADYSSAKVLEFTGTAGSLVSDPWNPMADVFMAGAGTVTADYAVDPAAIANGSTVFNTVQAAINRAALDASATSRTARIYISVAPATYGEILIVPALTAPITIYGTGSNAAATKIAASIDAAMPTSAYASTFNAGGTVFSATASVTDASIWTMYNSLAGKSGTLGTSGSAMVWIKNAGFQAKNITFDNTYNENRTCSGTLNASGQCPTGNHQAVALMVDGADKTQFENVRFIGNQDTLYIKSSAANRTVRAFFNNSYVEGDVDFIFGRATAYFRKSEIKSLGVRSASVYATAPSTHYGIPYGFVFDDCDFTSDGLGVAATQGMYLGRQWFEGVRASPYSTTYGASVVVDVTNSATNSVSSGDCGHASGSTTCSNPGSPAGGSIKLATLETVGKVVILNSRIGAHVNMTAPWSDWSSTATAAAYRLATYDSADYWAKLTAAGKSPATLYPGGQKSPVEPFLSEYNNTGAGSGATP